jgi:hypothetical protein
MRFIGLSAFSVERVSAISAECCPPSERNGVRDGVEYAQ